ncbi:MAG: N(4)-(beta-N-acetylglucosaminyl)-L-asparaginase [Acidobacteriota bacterium]|nr:N(4)-(beta-N-acetylglucosaminyl)-L-asparaginase [Acidobacteriota bacterium]
MCARYSRRELVVAGGAAGLLGTVRVGAQAPAVRRQGARPVVIASTNGHAVTNGGSRTCVEEAFECIARGDDVLDALVAGVGIVELDPSDSSVGFGGLPNADGVVQLDACCMHGPRKRAGGVAALEGVRTPAAVAQTVADTTDHHLLVGPGAQRFARQMGFEIEDDLNTDRSRALWLEWKRRIDPQHYLDPAEREAAGVEARREMVAEGRVDEEHVYGTINCNGVNARGDVCGVTTTSGLAWKIPGRVGDSPILGAGLYVDGDVGAAGSTGRGEANLYSLASFLIVEEMRRGAKPLDAGMSALRRVSEATIEKRLLTEDARPAFNLKFYVVDRAGEYAGVAMWSGEKQTFAVCTEGGAEIRECESLHGLRPVEEG